MRAEERRGSVKGEDGMSLEGKGCQWGHGKVGWGGGLGVGMGVAERHCRRMAVSRPVMQAEA